MNCIKYCQKEGKISIPMQLEYVHEILSKAAIDTSLVKHASTIEAAQDELLICLGSTLKEKLQLIWKSRKSDEIVRSLFLNICFKVMIAQLQGAIQDARQRAGKKSELEEYLESQQLAEEAKRQKKANKRSKKKKNAAAAAASAAAAGSSENISSTIGSNHNLTSSSSALKQKQGAGAAADQKSTIHSTQQNETSKANLNSNPPSVNQKNKKNKNSKNNCSAHQASTPSAGAADEIVQNSMLQGHHTCTAEPMEPLSESEVNFLIRIGWSECDVFSAGAITQADVDEHNRNTAKRESILAAHRKKLRENFHAMVKNNINGNINFTERNPLSTTTNNHSSSSINNSSQNKSKSKSNSNNSNNSKMNRKR